jgi:tetratricopeptide (TPR) repeat protein
MDRMLGNQYFMARKFEQAIPQFELTLQKHPDDLRSLRKLIISYIATEKIKRALDRMKHFLKLVPKDYFETEIVDENCPCPEIIEQWFANPPTSLSRSEYLISMGILHLFCGRKDSQAYFNEAKMVAPEIEMIDDILKVI